MSATGGVRRWMVHIDEDGVLSEHYQGHECTGNIEVVPAAAFDALAAKLAEAEWDLRTSTQVITVANAEIAHLTRELDERQTEHERLAKMLHAEQIANAALREVVEAAKAYRADHADCSREKCTESQRVVWDLFDAVDALAALDAMEGKNG